jgi:hypothetical protein
MGYVSTQRSARGNRRVDDGCIHHGHAHCGPKRACEVKIATAAEILQLGHEHLGHQDKRHARKVLDWMEINMSMAETGGLCDVLGKGYRKPFTPQSNQSHIIGEQIHANVKRPTSLKSLRGGKYYVCFKDDYIKYRRVFFTKERNKVSKYLCTFLNEMSTAGHRVKMFQYNGGKEFTCEKFVVSSVIVVLHCCCRHRMHLNKTKM